MNANDVDTAHATFDRLMAEVVAEARATDAARLARDLAAIRALRPACPSPDELRQLALILHSPTPVTLIMSSESRDLALRAIVHLLGLEVRCAQCHEPRHVSRVLLAGGYPVCDTCRGQ